jgi:hypothetical protein
MPSTATFAELPDGWLLHRASSRLKFVPPFDWQATLGYSPLWTRS